jgi:hypothetical protein
MRAALVLVAVLAVEARADDGAFGRLQERGRSWTFELVEGKALAALAPVKGAPPVQCTVVDWPAAPAMPHAMIECRADPKAQGALAPTIKLVIDGGVAREIRDDAEIGKPGRIHPFTFPETVGASWTLARPADGVSSRIVVRAHKLAISGTPVTAWLAETSQTTKTATLRGAAIYDPGHGPILLCPELQPRGLRCLRRTQLDPKDARGADPLTAGLPPPPPPPPPQPRISLGSKVAQDKSSLKADKMAARVASAYVNGMRRCYRDLLRKKPAAVGTLKLSFTVNAVGKTEDAAVTGVDATLDDCVRGQIAAWKFPIPMSEYGEPRTARFVLEVKLAVQ